LRVEKDRDEAAAAAGTEPPKAARWRERERRESWRAAGATDRRRRLAMSSASAGHESSLCLENERKGLWVLNGKGGRWRRVGRVIKGAQPEGFFPVSLPVTS
jgi:hypothetical protein